MTTTPDVQSALDDQTPSEPNYFKEYFHGLRRQVKPLEASGSASGEVQAVPAFAKQEAAPINHIRRKRYMSFRPLFVYRLLSAEAHHSDEQKESRRLHSPENNMENSYDYFNDFK